MTEHDIATVAFDAEAMTERVVAALRTVHDPEIPVNIYDLGLIYRVDWLTPSSVEIDMTLTAPGCPVAGQMLAWVEEAVRTLPEIAEVKVNLVFDPPWDRSRMSEEVQLELGLL
ncbi:iron-sulfur cluster assembly protein [Xanthobacter sp. KR7-225]|uniref:iron-sulfur cluster assembly protein n=1 Tax=Xanthobacter sp. KR7-225 TaxID=3156613 RepID=UPI0032B523A3